MSFIKLLGFWIDPYIDMNFEGSSCDTFNIRNLEQHGPRNSISLATPLLTVILTATCFWAWSVLGLGLFAGTITVQRDIIKIQNRHTKFQNRAIRETITFPVTQWGCWKMYAPMERFEPECECLYCRCFHSGSKSMNYDCSVHGFNSK